MLDIDESSFSKNEGEEQNISDQPEYLKLEDQEQSGSKKNLGLLTDTGDQIQDYDIQNDQNLVMSSMPIQNNDKINASSRPKESIQKPSQGRNNCKNTYKKMAKPKNFNNMLAIDTDAINALYTCGGEQGNKKTEKENEMEDFENGILDLATQCIAAMNRAKPSDPVIYGGQDSGQTVKKSFEQKFGNQLEVDDDERAEIDENEEYVEDLDSRPNYFRPNFNMP